MAITELNFTLEKKNKIITYDHSPFVKSEIKKDFPLLFDAHIESTRHRHQETMAGGLHVFLCTSKENKFIKSKIFFCIKSNQGDFKRTVNKFHSQRSDQAKQKNIRILIKKFY